MTLEYFEIMEDLEKCKNENWVRRLERTNNC